MGYVGNSPVSGPARILEGSGTGDGTTTSFPMGFSPAAEQEVFVFIDGHKQDTDAYAISGSDCLFAAAPFNGENFDFIGYEVGKATVPQDTPVDTSKVNDGSIQLSQLRMFTSEEQTITSAGALTIPHNLSGSPSLVQFRLICKTTEANYSVNDELIISPLDNNAGGGAASRGIACTVDATNINIRYANNANTFTVFDKTTGAAVSLINANWRMVVRAWA